MTLLFLFESEVTPDGIVVRIFDAFIHCTVISLQIFTGQNVVDTEGVEIPSHLREAFLPPFEPAFLYFFPIVRGEFPILPFYGEHVGRSSSLHVHIEQVGRYPRLNAVAVHPDWDVALYDNAVLVGVIHSFLQLQMQVVLDEVINVIIPMTKKI